MSHWNYRWVEVEEEIGLYEVYYDDDGKPNGRTQELATFSGATKLEAFDAYSIAGRAMAQPVLRDSDLGGGQDE